MQVADYVVLFGYFVVMIVIGVLCSLRIKKQEDFFMGGRGFGRLLQTFAAFGAGTGAQDPINVGRTTWTSGLSGIWSALMWLFVTPFYWILGVWYRRMRHLTLGDWFVERYESQAMGVAYTAFALCFQMMYLSAMFSAITKVAVPLIGDDVAHLLSLSDPGQLKFVLVPVIAVVVIAYGVMGGLRAAYWTDLLQGIAIIVLSIILIPAGLSQLTSEFGDSESVGMLDGFQIMHSRVASDYFQIFEGPRSGEFPLHYIISLTLLGLIGIVVQPHFIATGGGSAKSENSARLGLVTGNFLKRFCTIGWGITALIVLALMADSVEAAMDPDYVWGAATKQILGPLGLGLVGLMLACLLAALMSSADCYMLIASGLLVRNVYAPYFNPHASEQTYITAGRIVSVFIIGGACAAALTMYDVFRQYTFALELPICFAAPFWIGMYWRRANFGAAWLTIAFSFLVFFVIPPLAPVLVPSLREDQNLAISNYVVETTMRRPATETDVARRQAWEQARQQAEQIDEAARRAEVLAAIGNAPPEAEVGQPLEDKYVSGGASIFWSGGVTPLEEETVEPVGSPITATDPHGHEKRVVRMKKSGTYRGEGSFNVDFLLYYWLGMDLREADKALLATLRLPPRLITPFLIMILLSLLLPRNSQDALDRYYVKMKTPVAPDPQEDQRQLKESYEDPHRFDDKKLFPGSQWEVQRPTTADVVGFLVSVVICFLFVGLAYWLAQLGS